MLSGLPQLPLQLDSGSWLCPTAGCREGTPGLALPCRCVLEGAFPAVAPRPGGGGGACCHLGGELCRAGPCWGGKAAPGAGSGDPSLTEPGVAGLMGASAREGAPDQTLQEESRPLGRVLDPGPGERE